MKEQITVAAVDPGLRSGVAMVDFWPDGNCHSIASELPVEDMLDWCEQIIVPENHLTVVTCERFVITPKTVTNTHQPWAIEMTGLVRVFAERAGVPFTQYTAAKAKGAVTNDMLREVGLWHRGGKGHANDALRHAIVAAIERGWRPTLH